MSTTEFFKPVKGTNKDLKAVQNTIQKGNTFLDALAEVTNNDNEKVVKVLADIADLIGTLETVEQTVKDVIRVRLLEQAKKLV